MAGSAELRCTLEYRADETRESPGHLTGVLVTYETRARTRPEMFARGSLSWPEEGVILNRQHNRGQPIMRFMPELVEDEIRIDLMLPDTTRGQRRRDRGTQRHPVGSVRRVWGAERDTTRWAASHRAGRAPSGRASGLSGLRQPRRGSPPGEAATMAVTLTVGELAAAIRVGDTTAETAEVTRLLAYAITAVSRHLGTAYAGAPEDAVNEATVRLVGLLV